MRVHLFVMVDNELRLNKEEALLYPEFAAIWNDERNKTKSDRTGAQKAWAWKIFKYCYFEEDYRCEYFELGNKDKRAYAISDSGITEAEIELPEVQAAKAKYKHLQGIRGLLRLLRSSYIMIDSLREFFEDVSFTSTDPETGKPLNSAKDAMANLGKLGDVVQGLESLEHQVMKDMEKVIDNRGDAEEGLFDRSARTR